MSLIKKISILLFLTVVSCASPESKPTIEGDTSRISMLKEMFHLRRSLDSIQTNDVQIKLELEDKKEKINQLIEKALDYKQDRVEIFHLQSQMIDITNDRTHILKQVDSLKSKNESLITENTIIKSALDNERKDKDLILSQKSKLERDLSSASKLYVTSVKISGIGISQGLFGKPKDIETNKESKINRIKIAFTLPSNPVAKKETKDIAILAYSASRSDYIEKDTIVQYNGTECNITLTMGGKVFKNGSHIVRIYINNNLQTENEFVIVK